MESAPHTGIQFSWKCVGTVLSTVAIVGSIASGIFLAFVALGINADALALGIIYTLFGFIDQQMRDFS